MKTDFPEEREEAPPAPETPADAASPVKRRGPARGLPLVAVAALCAAGLLAGPWSLQAVVNALLRTPAVVTLNALAGLVLALVLIVSTLRRWVDARFGDRLRAWIYTPQAFLLLSVLTVLVYRWPTFGASELNLDESQEIAGVDKLMSDPRYWISLSGGTHGPLVTYVLMVPRLFGMICDFGSIRLVGVAFCLLSLYCLYRILRLWIEEPTARILTLPAVLAIATVREVEYIHFNAEQPIALLVIAAACVGLRSLHRREPPSLLSAFWVGFLLGLIPYTKLQGLPPAALVGGGYVALVLYRFRGGAAGWMRVGVTVLAAALPTVLVLAYVRAFDTWEFFWYAQVLANVAYMNRLQMSTGTKLLRFAAWLGEKSRSDIFVFYALVSCAIGALAAAKVYSLRRREPEGRVWALRILAALAVLLSVSYAVYRPGSQFTHYLQLLVFPVFLLHATLWGFLMQTSRRLGPVLAAVAVTFFVSVGLPYGKAGLPTMGPVGETADAERRAVVQVIRRYSRPEEHVAVWGWCPLYYVLSGRLQATRHNHLPLEMERDPDQRRYFLKVFVDDLREKRPPVFVDATGVGSYYVSRKRWGHERYPLVHQFVRSQYVLVATFEQARIYVLRERWMQEKDAGRPVSAAF